MAGGNGRQRKAVTPTQQAPAKQPAKQPDSAGGNGRKREKK